MRSIAAEYGWPDHKVETRTPISMSREQLAAFAGAYTSSAGKITITATEKGLKVQVPGDTAEFLPESETRFFPITPGAPSLVFEKNADGKVIGVKGGNVTATRQE
jgi:hypothetical protein